MKLSSDHVVNTFCKENKPALRVEAPATITVSTLDCYSNMLRQVGTEDTIIPSELINPATGPIYIENVMPGDTLKITINKIEIDSMGVVSCGDDCGPLAKHIKGHHLERIHISDGKADFLDKFQLQLHKMIGVIGVAPAEGSLRNSYPGRHGGNMDTNMITEGTTLYLPVFVEGALLAMGDVHALMGDGEVGGSGLEIPADITVSVEVISGKSYDFPIAEDDDNFCFIATAPTLDEASETAVDTALEFLKSRLNLETHEIIMLMSLVGNLQISQIVDPEMTVRFTFPKKYLDTPYF